MRKIIKIIYELIPLKKQIFVALKKVYTPNQSVYKHFNFTGVIDLKLNEEKSFKMKHYGFELENELFWNGVQGGWEKVSLGLWIKLCKKSNLVFDIGANTGIYSLISKTINKDAEVYAFEPVRRVFEKLELNNAINGYNIKCLELAASNYNGTAVIYDTPTPHIYSVTVNKNLDDTRATIETKIETTTLDSIIEKHHISKVDLVKIDVETHEAEVLEGFQKHLKKFTPTILIEILNDEVGMKVEKIVAGMNYLYFNIDERNGIRKVDKITKSDFYNYLLCSADTAKELNLI